MKRITSSQRWLIKKLSKRVQVPEQFLPLVTNALDPDGYCTRQAASQLITFLEQLPMVPPTQSLPRIPTGLYSRFDRDGVLVHYAVTTNEVYPDVNKVVILVDGDPHGKTQEIVTEWRREYILRCLANDLVASMQRYGKATGICGYCYNLLLGDSRRRGIGEGCYHQMKSHEKYLAQEDNRVYTARIEKPQQEQQTTKETERMDQKLDSVQFISDDMYTLEIFLHYARALDSHPTVGEHRFNRALDTLRGRGLAKIGEPVAPKTHGVTLTECGKKYLDMVLSTPLPVYRTIQEWYDPREVKK